MKKNKTIPIEQWEELQKKLNEKVVNKIESDFVEEGKALAEMANPKGSTTMKGIIPPMPTRKDFPEGINGAIDYGAAKNEYKKKYNHVKN